MIINPIEGIRNNKIRDGENVNAKDYIIFTMLNCYT